MATMFGPPLPDPLAVGIRSAGGSISNALMQQALQQLQQQRVNADMQLMQNMLNPERNELNAQQRFAQGLPLLQGQTSRHTGEVGTAQPQFQSPQGQQMMMNILAQKQLSQILNPLQQQQLGQREQSFGGEQDALTAQTQGRQAQTAATLQNTQLQQKAAKGERQYLKARTKAIKEQAREWKNDLKIGGTRGDAVVANIAQGAEQLQQRAEQMGDRKLSDASRTLSDTVSFYMEAMKQNRIDNFGEEEIIDPALDRTHKAALAKLLPEMERIARIQAARTGTLQPQSQPSADPLGWR